MPPRTVTARLFAVAALIALSGCGAFATPGEELWPYGDDSAEANDPPRLVTGDAARNQDIDETAPQ